MRSRTRRSTDGQAFAKACRDGTDAGTAIGVTLVLGIGFFGVVFLSLIWFMTRRRVHVVVEPS